MPPQPNRTVVVSAETQVDSGPLQLLRYARAAAEEKVLSVVPMHDPAARYSF